MQKKDRMEEEKKRKQALKETEIADLRVSAGQAAI